MSAVQKLILSLILIASSNFVAKAERIVGQPLAHTYSIVAFDSATGQFGAAVQSHYFRVADVIWVEAGVGAVATQSLVDFSYGPLGIEMMRNGKTANQALKGLLASDEQFQVRQVAMVDRFGNVATHTGEKCIAYAGHHQGKYYSCEANLMRDSTVWGAMAKAFENTQGDLAERMIAALDAAQKEGGDIRGKQSAAIRVVTGKPTGQVWKDRTIDLRVDDSSEPLVELRRLLTLTRAYDHENRGDDLIALKKVDEALVEYRKAEELSPDNTELVFWRAVTLVSVGKVDDALPVFKSVFAKDPSWRILVPRLVKSELLPNDPVLIKKITDQ